MNFRKNLKESRGITLIALVITIIVLLILAGVSLNLVAGGDGILSKATTAVDKTNSASIEEEISLAIADVKIEYYEKFADNKNSTVSQYIEQKLRDYTTSNGAKIKYNNGEISYEKDGQNSLVKVDLENGTIGEVITDANATTVQEYNSQHPELHIPTGFAHKEGTVSQGYVISDSEGNEFVWIPVASSSDYVKKAGTNNGYMTSSGGNSTELSEMVQGDILGVSKILQKDVTATLDANQPESKIVNSAGGFWVGRYETGIANVEHENIAGINGNTNDEKSATVFNNYWENKKNDIVVKQDSEPVRNITQSKAMEIANNWKNGSSANGTVAFQSGLITGSQWDVMCDFIGWKTCNSDCSSWGNYGNVKSSEYDGYCSGDGMNNWLYQEKIVKENVYDSSISAFTNRFIFPTGKFVTENGERTEKKNIFDIAGNVWEWTTEISHFDGNTSVLRGGGCESTGTYAFATYRSGGQNSNYLAFVNEGFRIVLYVE